MAGVEASLQPDTPCVWNYHTDTVAKLWKAAGLKGKPTLKGLRALPA